jgi:response regulator of citrate/malate metabolism
LAELEKNQKQSQARLDEANKKKKKIDQDREFYKGKPLPEDVKASIRDNEKEVAAQSAAVAAKVKEAAEVRARFEDERKRYLELTGKKPTEGAAATPATAAAAAPAPAAPAAAKPAEKK